MATKKRGSNSRDINIMAWESVQIATSQMEKPEPSPEKDTKAVTLGRLGGLKGGKARAESLSPAKRRAIAKKAAKARWRDTE